MRRKRYLPTQPLSTTSAGQIRCQRSGRAAVYLTDRLGRLARGKREFPSEFDRLLAPAEAWSRAVYAEAGMEPNSRARRPLPAGGLVRITDSLPRCRDPKTRGKEPDLVLGIALTLGELIGEARAHLSHGKDAARGLKAVLSAREGHEQVHGTKEAKEARWREHVRAFERHRANGHSITTAQSIAAEECGVSCKTIFNARSWARAR